MNMKPILAVAGALGVAVSMTAPAGAAYVYNNLNSTSAGDCSFSTTCAAEEGRGNDFAAQLFTLSSSAIITGGQFT
jgi:hypothetical protein